MRKADYSIAVVGLWHLGCVTAACLAEVGYKVVGIDFDEKNVYNLKRGLPPLFEPRLEALIKRNIKRGRLSFATDFKTALAKKDFIFITFDVPVDEKDVPDVSIIYKACRKIAKYAPSRFVLVVMSQLPIGTGQLIKKLINKVNRSLKFKLIYNPENLRLGDAIRSFLKPDRFIMGVEGGREPQEIKQLYSFAKSPHFVMDLKSAEMVKHAINAYLASSISFINEIADMCEVTEADVRKVVIGLKSDKRIGSQAFLTPGLGFAGGTLGRDLQVLKHIGSKNHMPIKLINAVLEVNKERKLKIMTKIIRLLGEISGKTVALFGLTYKPGTSTLRRSVALEIANALVLRKASVRAYDPKIHSLPTSLRGLKICHNPEQAARGADLILLLTEWPEFRKLNFRKIKKLMKTPVFLDAKNFLNQKMLNRVGFQYEGIGIRGI